MFEDLRILYVEDDAMSRKVGRLLFGQMLGIGSLTIFEDSRDFLARAEALDPSPNLIFLDIHVPPHNGFEMLAMIRSSPKLQAVTVVALTASVMNEEVHQLRIAGFQGALAKPLNPNTMTASLERLLRREQVWVIGN